MLTVAAGKTVVLLPRVFAFSDGDVPKVGAPKRLQRRLVLGENQSRRMIGRRIEEGFAVVKGELVALYVVDDKGLSGEPRLEMRGNQLGDVVIRLVMRVIDARAGLDKAEKAGVNIILFPFGSK